MKTAIQHMLFGLLWLVASSAQAVEKITIHLDFIPDIEAGKTTFSVCARCHLPEAWGNNDGTYPQLAGQHVNVLMKQLLDIRNGIRQTSAGSYLALDPESTRGFLGQVKSAVGDISRSSRKPVLITSMDIRRYVRKLIELDLYELPVLSYQELTQEITIQPLSRIDM